MTLDKSRELSLLADRVVQCRILREHHVWEAVKTLWPDGWEDAFGQSRRAFMACMEADVLVDALMLLNAAAHRSVEAMTSEGGRWTCRIRADLPPGSQFFTATHRDLAAAIFEAFLLSIQQQEEALV